MRCLALSGLLVLFAGMALAADPLPSTRVQELIAQLGDRDFKVRGRAARDLGNLGLAARAAVPALAHSLHDSSTVVRDYAGKALAQVGPPAVPELIKALADRDAGIRNRAAQALGVIGPQAKDAVPALIAALKDKRSEVRLSAIAALGELGAEASAAAPKLVHLFHDRSDPIRELAGLALQQIGPAALDPLQKMLTDDDRTARLEAMRALGLFGAEAKATVPALRKAMKDNDARIRAAAAATLGNMGFEARDAVPELLDALRDKKIEVHHRTAEALVSLTLAGVPGMLEKVQEAENKQVWVRFPAAEGQAVAKDPLTPWLKDLLDKDARIRTRAVLALGNLVTVAEPRVLIPLKRMLQDENDQVRLCTAMTLARIQRNKAEMRLAVERATRQMQHLAREIQLEAKVGEMIQRKVNRVQQAMLDQARDQMLDQMMVQVGRWVRTYDPAVQVQMHNLVNTYICLKLTTRSSTLAGNTKQILNNLGPEAIPALVDGMNMVSGLGLGDC